MLNLNMTLKEVSMYQWDTYLETGNEKVDRQHKQCFAALNNLIEAVQQGKGDNEIVKTLKFLTEYVIMHFSDEEKLMNENNYIDYYAHKRFHDEFKVTVNEMTQKLLKEGATKDLMSTVIFTFDDWLINHIKGEDFRMAAFVKTRTDPR